MVAISKVVITDMPGPSWWEFLMQWGGLFVQAAAAAATVWAVTVALRSTSVQARWRHEDIAREAAVIDVVVKRELESLATPLEMLIHQFGGGKPSQSLVTPPANAQAIAAACRDLLDTPKTWGLVDKIGYLPQAREIAAVLAELPILLKACAVIEKRHSNGLSIEARQIWNAGMKAHYVEWLRLRALALAIDPLKFPYKDAS